MVRQNSLKYSNVRISRLTDRRIRATGYAPKADIRVNGREGLQRVVSGYSRTAAFGQKVLIEIQKADVRINAKTHLPPEAGARYERRL